jgi:hypothetical protein
LIIVKIPGGLGNQLFKLNKVLDLNSISKNVYLDLNHYEVDRYKRVYRFEKKFLQNKSISKLFKRSLIRFNKVGMKLKLLKFYEEKENNLTSNNVSEKFFIKYLSGSWEEDVIPKEDNLRFLNSMFAVKQRKTKDLVAVHFRTKNYDIKLSDEYYFEALKHFNQKFTFHIFGDDLDYLKIKIPILFKGFKYKIIEKENEVEAFEELKTYRNYISSNSTFCWWAVILNTNELGNVIGPKNWMDITYKIFRPDSWKLITNTFNPISSKL